VCAEATQKIGSTGPELRYRHRYIQYHYGILDPDLYDIFVGVGIERSHQMRRLTATAHPLASGRPLVHSIAARSPIGRSTAARNPIGRSTAARKPIGRRRCCPLFGWLWKSGGVEVAFDGLAARRRGAGGIVRLPQYSRRLGGRPASNRRAALKGHTRI
jgi:hypothetical protein